VRVYGCEIGRLRTLPDGGAAFCAAAGTAAEEYLRAEEAVPHAAALALLRCAWAREHPDEPMPEVARRPGGKPFFPARPEVRFSLTHAGALVLCAMGAQEVGLDVEAYAGAELTLTAAFTPEERAYVLRAEDAAAAFCRVWVRKESLVKQSGAGLGALRETESVVTAQLRLRTRAEGRYLRALTVPRGYAAAICLAQRERIEQRTVPLEALVSEGRARRRPSAPRSRE